MYLFDSTSIACLYAGDGWTSHTSVDFTGGKVENIAINLPGPARFCLLHITRFIVIDQS